MEELLNKINELERLSLPNGARNAVWLTDLYKICKSVKI